jgi:hypothetical protein
MPIPCCAMALRVHFQYGVVMAWYRCSMACVNQTRPNCVNQMGKTQSRLLAAWHDRGMAWYVWISFYTHCSVSNALVNINVLILIPFHFIYSEIYEWKLCFVLLIVSVWTYVTLRCPFFWKTMPHHGWWMLHVAGLFDDPIVKGCMSNEWRATEPWRWDQFTVLNYQSPISHLHGVISQEKWEAHTRLFLRLSNLVAPKTPYILFS